MEKISFVRRRVPGEKTAEPSSSNARPRRIILVLGMHRSGTSMLTEVLHRLGAGIGPSLLQADEWNAGGYWESRPLHLAIDRFLHAARSCWFDLATIPADIHCQANMRPHYEAIRSVVDQETRGRALSVIKDPRSCRLVPLWRDLFADIGAEPIAVIHFRNPLAVADSLARRNGLSAARSCLLWLRHVVDAEFGTRSWPRMFIDDATLLSDWRRALQPLIDLGCYDAKRLSGPLGSVIDGVIKPQRRHHNENLLSTDALPEPREWFLDTHQACIELANENRHGAVDARFDKARGALEAVLDAMEANMKEVAAHLLQNNGERG